MSAKKVKVPGRTLQINSKTGKVKIGGIAVDIWDTTPRKKKRYPKEEVQNVKAEGYRVWTVKFEPKGEMHY
jgi:hypothetical protein